MKVAGAGPNLPWLEFAGVIPVQSTLPDGYMSLQTGVYSGWVMFPSAYAAYKFHEPAPYYTMIGFGAMGGAVLVTMNTRSLERLPPEVQRIVRRWGAATKPRRRGFWTNGRRRDSRCSEHPAPRCANCGRRTG